MTSRVTQEEVAEFCHKHSLLARNDKIVIGLSGGPDSSCLLHLLVNFSTKFELSLIIAHLNHQLRPRGSRSDENFARRTAAHWQIPIRVERCNVTDLAAKRKQSIEEAGRQIRYAFLWRVAQDVGANKIAVGHNADDQVETVLMHFLRGAGQSGLRGMLPLTTISSLNLHPDDIPEPTLSPAPKLIRPLLDTSREDIEIYCQEHKLSPRQDYSNQDTTFFRNRLRHELIPLLESYNPNIRQGLRRTAKVITAEVEILRDHLDKVWRSVTCYESPELIEFDLQCWLDLPLAMKRSTLRWAVQLLRRSLRDINFEHIEAAISIVEKRTSGAKATLPQGLILTVGYKTITIASKEVPSFMESFSGPQLAKEQAIPISVPGVSPLPDTDWQLYANIIPYDLSSDRLISQVDRWEIYLDADIVGNKPVLRPRRPGDRFCPLGLKGHSKKVNDFMINEKIPAAWRSRIPLLVAKNQILWVCGYRSDERTRIRPGITQRILHLKFTQ